MTPPELTHALVRSDASREGRARRSDGGFVILDVLLGILVLAILLLTVIMSVGPYRQRSYQASAISDARQLGGRIEATLSDNATLVGAGLPAGEDALSDAQLSSLGVNLTRGVAVARYTPLSSTKFQVCLVHYSGSTVDAFALYDSTVGRVTTSGRGAGPAACVPAGAPPVTPTPTDSPSPTSGPEVPVPTTPGPTTPPASSIGTPTNVKADAVPGETKATVTWDAVPGAAGYAIYLDGSSSPEWTGTGLTADLTSLAVGPHSVTVTARAGGDESAKSPTSTFTIYGDNDMIANAHPVSISGAGATWTTRDYTNANATLEPGETEDLGAQRGKWWTFVATSSGTTRLTVIAASDGTGPFPTGGIHAWKSTATTIAGVQASPKVLAGYRSNVATFSAVAGETYKIRIGNTYGEISKYRLKVETSPANDDLAGAITIPAIAASDTWTSPDQNNDLAGLQAGETDNLGAPRSMWWTYTATTGGTTQVSIISANDGSGPYPNGGIWVWETSASTIAAVEASPVKANAYRANATTFNATKGQTYKVRIGTTYNEVANFRVRVETGPGNDNVSDAVSINALSSGQSYTSPDWTNALAGKEAGENDDLSSRGLWWAYTATTTGSVRVSVIADSTGATLPRPSTYAWDSTATTASQVQTGTRYGDWGTSVITFPVTAGKTYKIRVGNVYGDLGKFRLKLDAL